MSSPPVNAVKSPALKLQENTYFSNDQVRIAISRTSDFKNKKALASD